MTRRTAQAAVRNNTGSTIAGAADAMEALASGGSSLVKAAATEAVAQSVTSVLFNSGTTDGFRQHIFRAEDENEVTEIVLKADRTITFRSRSGDSDTVATSKAVQK